MKEQLEIAAVFITTACRECVVLSFPLFRADYLLVFDPECQRIILRGVVKTVGRREEEKGGAGMIREAGGFIGCGSEVRIIANEQ